MAIFNSKLLSFQRVYNISNTIFPGYVKLPDGQCCDSDMVQRQTLSYYDLEIVYLGFLLPG